MKCSKTVDKGSAGQPGFKAQKDSTRGKKPALANIKTKSPTPLPPAGSASADLSRSTLACSNCNKLRKENASLKSDLQSLRDVYQQLVCESKMENYSERRVNLLKAHVTQLERQVMLLSQALSQRSTILADVEQSLADLEQKIKLIQSAAKFPETGTQATVPTAMLDGALDAVKSARTTTTRNARVSGPKDYNACPLAYTGPYVATEQGEELTVMDVIGSGKSHKHPFNYIQLSWLEGQLSQLYQCLCQLEASCSGIPALQTSKNLGPLVDLLARLSGHVTQCRSLAGGICQHLLTLSLLIPGQTPQRVLVTRFVSIETLLKQLPPFSRDKQEARKVLQQLLAHFQQVCESQDQKISAFKEEVIWHRSHHKQQLTHLESVFGTLSDGYKEFVSTLEQLINEPLQAILAAYERCLQEHSESAGSELLAVLSGRAAQLHKATAVVSDLSQEKGSTALLQFATEFTHKATAPASGSDVPAIK